MSISDWIGIIVLGVLAVIIYLAMTGKLKALGQKVGLTKGGVKASTKDGIDWSARPIGWVSKPTDRMQKTPLGISIYSKNGTDSTVMTEVDRAYVYERERAEREGGYLNLPAPEWFDIYIPEDVTRSPEQGTPSFKVRSGADYDGTGYDQYYDKKFDKGIPLPNGLEQWSERDGVAVIFAAEMITGMSTEGSYPRRDSFLICPEIAYEATCNGLQHIFLAHGNGWAFSQSAGAGHSHPLAYPPVDAPVALSRSIGATRTSIPFEGPVIVPAK